MMIQQGGSGSEVIGKIVLYKSHGRPQSEENVHDPQPAFSLIMAQLDGTLIYVQWAKVTVQQMPGLRAQVLKKVLIWLTYCSYCKNSFTALRCAGLSEVINDGINVCSKEFDKTVVFPAKSGKLLAVFSQALANDVPSKAETSVLAYYYLFILDFGESTVTFDVAVPQVLLTG